MDSPIKNILEVEAFLSGMVKAGIDAKKNDGTIDFKDTSLFLPPLLLLPAAIEGIGSVGDEFKVLPDHIDELAARIGPDFGLDAAGDVVFFIEQGVVVLKAALAIYKHLNAPKVAAV